MADAMSGIVPLDELDDFQISEGDPDVRGWQVVDSSGTPVGRVDQLLVDTAARKVRYLSVAVNAGLTSADSDRHVLIPIGYARLHERDNVVNVDAPAGVDVAGLPTYARGPVTREYETSVCRPFGHDAVGAQFYQHDAFDVDRFYAPRREVAEGDARIILSEEEFSVAKREVQAGEVVIVKRVETERVQETVPLRHQEVTMERRPAPEGMGMEVRSVDGEMLIPIVEEELVVTKRLVVREVMAVKRQDVVEEETVEAELRRERIEVREEGDVRRT